MTTPSIPWTESDLARRPLVERLHEWVVWFGAGRLAVASSPRAGRAVLVARIRQRGGSAALTVCR